MITCFACGAAEVMPNGEHSVPKGWRMKTVIHGDEGETRFACSDKCADEAYSGWV